MPETAWTPQDHLDQCIEVDDPEPCLVCATPTTLIECNFEGAICSLACWDKIWTDFHEANRTLGPPTPWDEVADA